MSTPNKKPLVSVIMPTYNRELTLPDSIQSIIDQTYQNWELIVVDDRSIDNTKDMVESLIKKDSRIKYYRNEYSQGPAGARNFGIDNSFGEYISFLDSDDFWLPRHLEECICVLESENIEFCTSKLYEKENDNIYPSIFVGGIDYLINNCTSKKGENFYYFPPSICEFISRRNLYPYHISTAVIKKTTIISLGKFDEELFGPEDTDLLFKLVLRCGLCIIDNFHSIWVQGEDNIHFFKGAKKTLDLKTVEKINRNRLHHIKLYQKQKSIIKINKNKFANYKLLLYNKNYDIFIMCLYLAKLNNRRNVPLYFNLLLKSWYFYFLIPSSIFKARKYNYIQRNRPRVLFERLPRVSIKKCLDIYSENDNSLLNQLSVNNKNFWLYFERDIIHEIKDEKLVLTNYKTKQTLTFTGLLPELGFLKSKSLLINITKLKNKKIRKFIFQIDKNNFGGLVESNFNIPFSIPLFTENKIDSFWN